MVVQYTADASDVSMVRPSCATAEDPPADAPPLPPLRLRFTVFFDGTGNNMFNTQTRVEHRHAPYDSFRNDYSNVAKLANYIDTPDGTNNFHIPVYVEGMGTEHGSDEDIDGTAFGTGERGVMDRVTSAVGQIAREARRLSMNSNRVIDDLKIDSFGFSRGAASARHFLYRIDRGDNSLVMQLADEYGSSPAVRLNNLSVPFVGLYDCVASFRIHGWRGPLGSITNDTEELHLDSFNGPHPAQKVTHIVASDEFRLNFPITNIASAGARGKTIYLPGVHSDVGGGYNNLTDGDRRENNLPILRLPFAISDGWDVMRPIQRRFAAEMQRLINLGWYTREEFVTLPTYDPTAPNSILSYDPFCVNRSNISNAYPRIPLRIMISETASAGLVFLSIYQDENPLEDLLPAVFNHINANRNRTTPEEWNTDMEPIMLRLRHGYFHFSSTYAATHRLGTDWPIYALKSQFYSDQHTWDDSDPNILAGRRRRRPLDG